MSELFLFAGNVIEPDITVDRTKVDYGALMLGAALKETFHIVNREAMPHSFVFDKSSLGMAQVRITLLVLSLATNGRWFSKIHKRERKHKADGTGITLRMSLFLLIFLLYFPLW